MLLTIKSLETCDQKKLILSSFSYNFDFKIHLSNSTPQIPS